MGTVYLAEDTHLGRRVAVKFPSLTSDSHDYRARFLREARAVSDLNHPGIATLFDYGETPDGRPFLVMELAKGRSLSELMQKGELTLIRAVEIVTDIASALVAAHARGIVHRDIKPSNIMIDDEGKVKVLDFGLAKQLTKESSPATTPEAQTLLSTETRSGVVLGTPAYLSPEQAIGGAVDGRSDLFAVGTLLYECTTGHTPFTGKSFIEIAANVLHVEPTPPSKLNSQIPRELEFITLKALAKKPKKRYQTAKEMIADLQEVKSRLEEASGHTLIRRTSPALAAHSRTLTNLSQMLQRPRIPILYILIGVVALIAITGLAWRFLRPSPHKPTAEAERWYQVGTEALRDGAYFQASQALDRAIAADDAFMLAHARLAEALVELDYVDRAKDELLRVNSADRARLADLDALYLDAITASARQDFVKAIDLYKQITNQVAESEKPFVLVDLGRIHEKNNDDLQAAIQSYTDAAARNPQYATAFLHLGIAYGKQGDLAKALPAFDKAESIYQAMGKLEGRVEVVFQRGALLNKRNKLAEAKPQLEQALLLAQANDNKAQIIKALLQLCSVAFDGGETAKSSEYAQQAVDLAQRNGMENLSAQALVDLGNSFLVRGEPAQAEKYLTQALSAAERVKARRTEARARVGMGNLRNQQNKPDEALRYLEPALAFYTQGGYRTEAFYCVALLARVNLHKGDHAAAQKSQEQLLQLAAASGDQSLVALAHAERGSALLREEKYTESLQHLDQAMTIYRSQGVQRSIGYNALDRADVLGRLGRYQEAASLLDEAAAIADKPGGEIKRLSIGVQLARAQLALSRAEFGPARDLANKVLERAGSEFPNISADATMVLVIAQANSGGAAGAKKAATETLDVIRQSNEPAQIAAAQVALAQVLLMANDAQGALTNALEAEQAFARLGQQASDWRAFAIASLACEKAGDKTRAREYAIRAKDTLSKLEQRWNTESFNSYLSRPDVDRLRKQIDLQAGASI